MENSNPPKQKWLKQYTLVLAANVLYLLVFYFLMKQF